MLAAVFFAKVPGGAYRFHSVSAYKETPSYVGLLNSLYPIKVLRQSKVKVERRRQGFTRVLYLLNRSTASCVNISALYPRCRFRRRGKENRVGKEQTSMSYYGRPSCGPPKPFEYSASTRGSNIL